MLACARPVPALSSTTPLAKLSYAQDPPALFVGDQRAWVVPSDPRYTTLLDGPARQKAEASHKNRRWAAFLSLSATATALTTVVLSIASREDFFDPHTRPGRAMIGLTISSVTLGAVAGVFSRKAHADLHEAVNLYNDAVLHRSAAQGETAESTQRAAEEPAAPAQTAAPEAEPESTRPAVPSAP
jgi:hypothetical protein